MRHGESLGIIGRNGSGKSTILKLIAGVMVPTDGSIKVSGRVSPLIELGAGFHPDLTGQENVYLNASILGLSNDDIRANMERIVEFSGLREFMDTPVKRYSSGMYLRLAFAVAVHANPEILLVDEALAVGDEQFQEKCVERMADLKSGGATILLVSHGLELVANFCDRVLLIDSGRLAMDGSPSEVIAGYHRMTHAAPAPAVV